MICSPATPGWARDLALVVCAEAGLDPPHRLRWWRRDRPLSSGVTRRGEGLVAVVAGTDADDARATLLHELAHWLTAPVAAAPRRRRGGGPRHHDRRFYAAFFALLRRHAPHDAAALEREAARYPSALRHAAALGVAGAAEALQRRRAAHGDRRRRGAWRELVAEHGVRLVRDGRWHACAVCGARIVGRQLAWARRRSGLRHRLLAREPA